MGKPAPPIPHGWLLNFFVERDTSEACEGSDVMKGISDAFPLCEIVENHEKFPSIFSDSKESFPRKGSFEISFTLQQPTSVGNSQSMRTCPTTLHSKIATGTYPSESIIISMLSQYVTTITAPLHLAPSATMKAPATRPDGVKALQMKALPPRPPLCRPSDGAQTERGTSVRASLQRTPMSARATTSSSSSQSGTGMTTGSSLPSAASLLTPSDLRDVLSQSEHAALLSIPAKTTHAMEANKNLPASRPTSRSTSRSSSILSDADTAPFSRLTPNPPSRPLSSNGVKGQNERPRTAGLTRGASTGRAAAGAGGGRPSSAGVSRRPKRLDGEEAASIHIGGERRVFKPPSAYACAERQYHSDGECVGSGRNVTRKLRSRPQSGNAGTRREQRAMQPAAHAEQARVDEEDGACPQVGVKCSGEEAKGDERGREEAEGISCDADDMAKLLSQGRKARAELAHLLNGGEVGGCAMNRGVEHSSGVSTESTDVVRARGRVGEQKSTPPGRRSPLMASEARGTRTISRPCDAPPQCVCDQQPPPGADARPHSGGGTEEKGQAATSAGVPLPHRDASAGGCSSEAIFAGLKRIVADLVSRGCASTAAATNGCRVIASLSSHPSNRRAACTLGAPSGVVAGMRAHRDSREVQEAGCSAVASLCCGGDASTRAEFISLGAFDLVLTALQTHSSCSSVVIQACRSLFGLSGALSVMGSIARKPQADPETSFAALRFCFQEESVQGRLGLGVLETLDSIAKGHDGTDSSGHTPQARGICSELLSLVRAQ